MMGTLCGFAPHHGRLAGQARADLLPRPLPEQLERDVRIGLGRTRTRRDRPLDGKITGRLARRFALDKTPVSH
jgi:hypothetical protein